jgi:parvulin-like peptidyl-prolyl isomerase/predicted small lipoprotein YifL
MKTLLSSLLLSLALVLPLAGCGKKAEVVPPSPADEVAVWVDETPITMRAIQIEYARTAAGRELAGELRQRALQSAINLLITRTLVRADMMRGGDPITAEEVEAARSNLIANRSGAAAEATLAMLLAQTGLTLEELESNIKLDLFKNRVVHEDYLAREAELTDEYLKEYYDSHPAAFTVPAGRKVSHILVRVAADAPEDGDTAIDAKKTLEEAATRFAAGESFESLALELSDDPSRERGGDIGLVIPKHQPPELDDAIFSTPVGSLSALVRSPAGYHLFLVREETPETLQPWSEELKNVLFRRMCRAAQAEETEKYYNRLRSAADIRFVGPLEGAKYTKVEDGAEEPSDAAETAPVELVPAADGTVSGE